MEKQELYNRAYNSDIARCFVPSCNKFRRDYSNVKFFPIPTSLQETWCRAVARNCPKRVLYVCEEHIDIDQDCRKKRSGKLCLKSTANLILTRTYYENAQETKKDVEAHVTQDVVEVTKDLPATSTKISLSENVSNSKRDSSSQTQRSSINKSVLAKPCVKSVCCSAKFRTTYVTQKVMPSQPPQHPSSTTSGTSTPSLYEPSSPSASSSTSFKENVIEGQVISGRTHILSLIKELPKRYIGVPKPYYFLVELLSKECGLRPLHVIITLFKIKQNDTLERISDHFNLSKMTVQEIIKNCITKLASYLQDYVYLPEPIEIKRNLPSVFKIRYANVQVILDCFEIQIEKPSNPIMQARTWSQYKSCNTLKYLIGCCPNGFICYISKGYRGRISDKSITEKSGFMDILPPGAVVLADRGFKGIEALLAEKHVKLLRPPTVSLKETPTKKEVIQTKVIASLRIHIERVIRRVREFNFLKPHSVINHRHVRYADESVIIACALANCQTHIIKIK